MIISFTVENFRSFAGEETLSLVASNRLSGSHEEHAVQIPDSKDRVLKTAVLYGANGAGKSNLFKALKYLRMLALHARGKSAGTGREAFRLDDRRLLSSSFDLHFITKQKVYRFGVKVDDQRIEEEWLVLVEGEKETVVYERATSREGVVTIEAPGFKGNEKLRALTTVGGPQNQTFLATVNSTLNESDFGGLAEIVDWFKTSLRLIGPDESLGPLGHMLSSSEDFLAFASAFLKESSTGVDHLTVEKKEISEDDLRKLLPAEVMSRALDSLKDDDDDTTGTILDLGNGIEILLERADEHHFYRVSVNSIHQNQPNKLVSFQLSQESDGTRRLLNLIPALHQLQKGGAVYVIDEIDRSMHPSLVWKFLEFFLRTCEGGLRQVLVTTHESNLLDAELLRRDEIWFVEKDSEGSSRLYSLMDFKVRKDLQIRKHYLQGRFGAVPFLGNLDSLLPDTVDTA